MNNYPDYTTLTILTILISIYFIHLLQNLYVITAPKFIFIMLTAITLGVLLGLLLHSTEKHNI